MRPKRPSHAHPRATLYPEVGAGGFTHVDGTVEFYQRINALLTPNMVVLDFGAGRGQFVEDPVAYRRDLHCIRGKVACVVGLDVDGAVLENQTVDRAEVIDVGDRLPLDDGSVDLIVSDWTFEHITNPSWAAHELDRVLKRGGWICARTPNRSGYVGLGARLVPNRFHIPILRRLQPHKADRDTFPTAYLMNTRSALRHLFPVEQYDHCIYAMNNEPDYFGASRAAWRVAHVAFRFTPDRLASFLYVFLHKH